MASLGQNSSQSAGNVVSLRQDRALQFRLVSNGRVGGADSHDRCVEAPKAVLRRPGRDLCTEARCDGVFVYDQEPARLFDRFGDQIVVPRRKRAKVQYLDIRSFVRELIGDRRQSANGWSRPAWTERWEW